MSYVDCFFVFSFLVLYTDVVGFWFLVFVDFWPFGPLAPWQVGFFGPLASRIFGPLRWWPPWSRPLARWQVGFLAPWPLGR
jgi:hypothetical protein